MSLRLHAMAIVKEVTSYLIRVKRFGADVASRLAARLVRAAVVNVANLFTWRAAVLLVLDTTVENSMSATIQLAAK